MNSSSSIKQRETRMVFRILAGIIGTFLLLGLPVALYGVFTSSGESLLWNIVWAIASVYAGLGMVVGARSGRLYDERA